MPDFRPLNHCLLCDFSYQIKIIGLPATKTPCISDKNKIKHIPRLEKTDIYCWFNLDGAGFEMLNMICQYYPNAKSFLINDTTFGTFEQLAVPNNPKMKIRNNLTLDERRLYHCIVSQKVRLEQEKAFQQFVLQSLDNSHR